MQCPLECVCVFFGGGVILFCRFKLSLQSMDIEDSIKMSFTLMNVADNYHFLIGICSVLYVDSIYQSKK